MFCKSFEQYAILYVYRELDDEKRILYEAHLQECSFCRREVLALQELLQQYRALPEEPVREEWITEIVHNTPHPVRPAGYPWRERVLSLCRKTGLSPVWSPAMAGLAVIILLMAFLLPAPENEHRNFDRTQVMAWETGVDDSLEDLQERIDVITLDKEPRLFAMPPVIQVSAVSVTDQQLDRIEREIHELSLELSMNRF